MYKPIRETDDFAFVKKIYALANYLGAFTAMIKVFERDLKEFFKL